MTELYLALSFGFQLYYNFFVVFIFSIISILWVSVPMWLITWVFYVSKIKR